MNAKKLLLVATLPLLLCAFQGCGAFKKDIILYPIQGSDIVMLSQSQSFVAPKNGAFLSDTYISEVMQCKVER